MGKETKIGISVVGILLVTFAGFAYWKMSSQNSNEPPAELTINSKKKKSTETKADQKKIAAGISSDKEQPTNPTVVKTEPKTSPPPLSIGQVGRGSEEETSPLTTAAAALFKNSSSANQSPPTPALEAQSSSRSQSSLQKDLPAQLGSPGASRYSSSPVVSAPSKSSDLTQPRNLYSGRSLYGQGAATPTTSPQEKVSISGESAPSSHSEPLGKSSDKFPIGQSGSVFPRSSASSILSPLQPVPSPDVSRGINSLPGPQQSITQAPALQPVPSPTSPSLRPSLSSQAASDNPKLGGASISSSPAYSPYIPTSRPSKLQGTIPLRQNHFSQNSPQPLSSARSSTPSEVRKPSVLSPSFSTRPTYTRNLNASQSRPDMSQNLAPVNKPISSAPGSASANHPRSGRYKIEPDDSFWRISQRFYGSGSYFKALYEHNRRRFPQAKRLKIGSEIDVPPLAELQSRYPDLCPKQRSVPDSTAIKSISSSTINLATREYVVQEGDTLSDIAQYELGKSSRWVEIYQLNRNLLGKDYNHLSTGVKLRLPLDDQPPVDPLTRRPGSQVR